MIRLLILNDSNGIEYGKSKATVQELVSKGCLEQIEGTSGRNVRYRIKI